MACNQKVKYTHRELDNEERGKFIVLYNKIEQHYPLLMYFKRSKQTALQWIVLVALFGIIAIFCQKFTLISVILSMCYFSLGLISLQVVFVVTHILAHAKFLEYNFASNINPTKSNTWVGLLSFIDCITYHPVYYYGFYHHHHTENDNWFPELSYYMPTFAKNVAVAHWLSYTNLVSRILIFVIITSIICPKLLMFWFGYEVGVLIVPIAHAWQHINHLRLHVFVRILFRLFESTGIVADKHSHHKHHVYNIPTVYQDFSSSGIYAEPIDKLLNKFWDWNFNNFPDNISRNIHVFACVISSCVTIIIPCLLIVL
jgi:hypothetical protein